MAQAEPMLARDAAPSSPLTPRRLSDPYGRQEVARFSLSQGKDVFALQRSGEYRLRVEGADSDTAPGEASASTRLTPLSPVCGSGGVRRSCARPASASPAAHAGASQVLVHPE